MIAAVVVVEDAVVAVIADVVVGLVDAAADQAAATAVYFAGVFVV